jgi:hypothetical protein
MDARPPGQADGGPSRWRLVTSALCTAAGLALGTVTVICLSLGICGGDQAVALGVPAALLVISGLLAAAIPDPAAGHRFGFKAGLQAGSMLSRWRSVLRRLRNRP